MYFRKEICRNAYNRIYHQWISEQEVKVPRATAFETLRPVHRNYPVPVILKSSKWQLILQYPNTTLRPAFSSFWLEALRLWHLYLPAAWAHSISGTTVARQAAIPTAAGISSQSWRSWWGQQIFRLQGWSLRTSRLEKLRPQCQRWCQLDRSRDTWSTQWWKWKWLPKL